jgi:hypothetical protein
LKNENVFAANVFIDFNTGFAVREFPNCDVAKRDMQLVDHFFGKVWVGVTRKNHHLRHNDILWFFSGDLSASGCSVCISSCFESYLENKRSCWHESS